MSGCGTRSTYGSFGNDSLAFDIFMNALRPSGVHRGSDPRHVLRVQPFTPDRRSGRLETNVWMGAYALRPSGRHGS